MPELTEEEIKKLEEVAREGMKNAFSIVFKFPVGAAVLTTDGHYFQGCNVETVISGLGTCAERCAIDNAVAHGHYTYRAVGVITTLEKPVKPCGPCLHYINAFAQVGRNNIEIYMFGKDGRFEKSTINDLLPREFGPRDLGLDLKKYESKQ